jgi:PPP family 3-phenylpropionic acid transporter
MRLVAAKDERTVQPNLALGGLNWAYVLAGAADATLLPYVPLYLFQRGMGAETIGAILAAAAAGSLLAGMGWAYLADHSIRPEHAVLGASVAAAAVVLLFPLAVGVLPVAALTVALFVARGPFTLLDPITLQRLREASRTRYARIRLRMSAGWAVSAVISGAGYQVFGFRTLPFLYAAMVAVFGLWVWKALRPAPAQRVLAGGTVTRRLPSLPVAMVGFLVACFLLGASSAAAQNFVALRINVLGGGALLIGAAAAFQALTEIPTMGSTHLLTRRMSHRSLFAIGCAVYVVVFLAWGLVSDPVALALLRLATGVAFALTYVAAVLVADQLTPAHMRATGQALVKAVMFGLAPIAGSYGGGLIYGEVGPRAMFIAATVVVAAAGIIAMIGIPESDRSAKPSDRLSVRLDPPHVEAREGVTLG